MLTLPPQVEAFVSRARVARLATVDESGAPHVVPVCFVYQDGCAYSVLDAKPKRVPARRLRRVRNLLVNPKVQLLVDRYDDEDWSRLAYVQLRGSAALLPPGEEQGNAVAALRARYSQYEAMDLDEAPVIKVTVESYAAWGLEFEQP